jgi:hypothetical protein
VFTVTTVAFRQLYVMVVIAHATRELIQVAATDSPTTQWCIQVMREATPFDVCPTSTAPKLPDSSSGKTCHGRTGQSCPGLSRSMFSPLKLVSGTVGTRVEET